MPRASPEKKKWNGEKKSRWPKNISHFVRLTLIRLDFFFHFVLQDGNFDRILPIPDFFYDVRATLPLIGSSPVKVRAATKHLDATHFDYEFASDGDADKGVVSFYDTHYDSSVLQLATNAWQRDGYSCFPEPPYQGRFYSVPYNYTECFDEILEPSSETVQAYPYQLHSYYYFPFGNLGSEQKPEGFAQLMSLDSIRRQYADIDQEMCADFGGLRPDYIKLFHHELFKL